MTSLVLTGSGEETNADQSPSAALPKASMWHKITKPIMSWFSGNNTEKEFESLKSNWTEIFENMQREMLRVQNRRWDGAKTKVPNWEDIFQFVYIDEHTTIFMGNTFESAAEKAYSCKRAFEAKEWSSNELKNECKLPKKMGRKNAFKFWTEKMKQFEAGQSVFECIQWTKRQEKRKLKEIFNAFLDGAPLPANICHEEQFKETGESEENIEGKETDKSKTPNEEKQTEKETEKSIVKERRSSWEKIRAQWSGRDAETERTAVKEEGGKGKKDSSWLDESESRERVEWKRKVARGKKRTKLSPQKRQMRKKVEEQRNAALSDQEESGESDQNRETKKKWVKTSKGKVPKGQPQYSTHAEKEAHQRYGAQADTGERNLSLQQQPNDALSQQQLTETETNRPIDGQQYGRFAVRTVKGLPKRRWDGILTEASKSTESESETATSKSDHHHYDTDGTEQFRQEHPFLSGASTELSEFEVGRVRPNNEYRRYGNSKQSSEEAMGKSPRHGIGMKKHLKLSSEETETDQSLESHRFYSTENAAASHFLSRSENESEDKNSAGWRIRKMKKEGKVVPTEEEEQKQAQFVMRKTESETEGNFGTMAKSDGQKWGDSQNANDGADNERRKEQQELFHLANAQPALWLNEFGEVSHNTDQRVAKWDCHTLTDHVQMAECRGWEDVHRAIKRFVKFQLAKEAKVEQNDDSFLAKVAIRPRIFTQKRQLDGQNAEIPLVSLMENAQAVHSGQMELDKAPTIWNKVLVERVEEWAEFLKENTANDDEWSIEQTDRQEVSRAREVLQMVNGSEELLEGMADQKTVPPMPFKHIPGQKAIWQRNESLRSLSVGRRETIGTNDLMRINGKHSEEKIGQKSENGIEEEEGKKEEATDSEKYKGQIGILNFARSQKNTDFWLGTANSVNWNCPGMGDNSDRCEEWALIHRAIRRYLAFLDIIEGKAMAELRESDLGQVAVFPRLRPEADSKGLTINNKAWIARLWGKIMTKDNGQNMDLKEAMRKVEEAHKLARIGQLKEPMELMNKVLVERVEGWAEFYAENAQQSLSQSIEEARTILSHVLVQTFDERNRIMPKIDMKIVKTPPAGKGISPERIYEQKKAIEFIEKSEKLPSEPKNNVPKIDEIKKTPTKTEEMKKTPVKIVGFEKMPTKIVRNRVKSRNYRRRKSSSKSREAILERRRALNAQIRQKVPKKDEEQSQNKRPKINERNRENENSEEKMGEKADDKTPKEGDETPTQIWEQKREFNEKMRKTINEIFGRRTIYLAKGKKPLKSDAIWPIFDAIESARDEKQLKNVEKMIPPEETDEEREKREELLRKWEEIERTLREQLEKYGTDAYANRLKNAKTNAPNQLVIVYTNFIGFKKYRVVLVPTSAEVVHTVYQVKNNSKNTYSMLGSNVFEAWKRAAKCVEIVQNGQIYMGGKECQAEIEAESRAEMYRKWTNLGKALQFRIGALYKENDGMFDEQKMMLLLEQAYGALLNGSALPPLPPNVSGTVEQKLYGEMLEKSAQMSERTLSRALSSFTRQKSILSENPIGDMKRTLSEKAREMLHKFWTGESVFLVKTKAVNADTIWRLFDQIDRTHDEKTVKGVEKQFPDEGPPEMRQYQLQKWQEIELILREQMEAYGRERYALRQQNADPNGPNADDLLLLNESKFFGLLRKKRHVLIPKEDETVHTVYRIEKPDKKTGFATIEHFGPNIFDAWKRAAQCLDAVKSGQQYASANEDCNWQLRTEYRHETAFRRWTSIGRAMKRGTEAQYKINEEILDEQKLLQLLEKAFVALVNGTELPALPEKLSADEIDNLKNGTRNPTDEKTMSESQKAETKSWWDTLKSYWPSANKTK
ncbi:hypothetical protein niasHS_015214 [Heterodera schachtii]|uniref:Uncharacterized protein n=1 Tax=Heterodera schachtii TaxID=97005 RepID=A0ABD2I1J3_HETSC